MSSRFVNAPVLTADERARVRGRRILLVMAHKGHVQQEALKPLAIFEAAGCPVTIACLDADRVAFDPIGGLLAVAEAAWDPTFRLWRALKRAGRFAGVPSLRALDRSGTLPGWLSGFDAVFVPGGHGRVFHDFLHDPLTAGVVRRFDRAGAVVGLVCHAAIVGAHPGEDGIPLVRGREVACWPRAGDRFFGRLPGLGRYMVPYAKPAAVIVEEAGARVHDRVLIYPRVHAVVDGNLVTSRGPWSAGAFAAAVLSELARRVTLSQPA